MPDFGVGLEVGTAVKGAVQVIPEKQFSPPEQSSFPPGHGVAVV